MNDDQRADSQAVPPHAHLIQMGTASWISAVVYAAAKLAIADHLAAEPRSATELAGATRTHAPSLHRLMRTLAGLGIVTERDAQRFALTPLGEIYASLLSKAGFRLSRIVPTESIVSVVEALPT